MPNANVLESKKAVVEELSSKINAATSVVFVNYSGITVAQDTELRKQFRDASDVCEVVALCDLYADRVARAQKEQLDAKKLPRAKLEFSGEEGWKKLCESDLDLVVNATPWALHAPIALYAMEHGKHVAIEVPAAMTLEEKADELLIHFVDEPELYDAFTNRLAKGRTYGAIMKVTGAKQARELQKVALAHSRLKIPFIYHEDVTHGFRTVLPVGLGTAVDARGNVHVGGRKLTWILTNIWLIELFSEIVVRTTETAVEDTCQCCFRPS